VDLPLLARSLGANVSMGLLSANLKSLHARTTTTTTTSSSSSLLQEAEQGSVSLEVSAELHMMGMSSYVSFDMSAQRGAAISAKFVEGQINKVGLGRFISAEF
jgi:hypothetical protein